MFFCYCPIIQYVKNVCAVNMLFSEMLFSMNVGGDALFC